jgi:hypothetical protein
MTIEQNPERYARLSVPFDSAERATVAVGGFLLAVSRLREQYKIPDCLVQVMFRVTTPDGEQLMESGAMFGDSFNAAPMAYRAFQQYFPNQMEILGMAVAMLKQAGLWQELAEKIEG